MVTTSRWLVVGVLGFTLTLAFPQAATGQQTPASATPRIIQPGTPGAPSREVGVEIVHEAARPHTQADVRFMQGMIGHHAQALAMAALVPARTSRQDIRLLALRVELSQVDEIKLMQEWLEKRGEAVPEISPEHTHHLAGGEPEFMPGMLTHEEMAKLEAASGAEFDRLFLELMIKHHEGALAMVDHLRAQSGAGQEDDILQMTIHIVADQSSEIRRMEGMLAGPRR
jgi:uncharacterized protein (DUF305 family)